MKTVRTRESVSPFPRSANDLAERLTAARAEALRALVRAHQALGLLHFNAGAGPEALALAGMGLAEAFGIREAASAGQWTLQALLESLGGSLPVLSPEQRAEGLERLQALMVQDGKAVA